MDDMIRPWCVIHLALHMDTRYDLHSQYVFMPCCVATVLFRLNTQLPCKRDVEESRVSSGEDGVQVFVVVAEIVVVVVAPELTR